MKLKKYIAKAMAATMLLGMFGVVTPAMSVKAEAEAAGVSAKVNYEDFTLDFTGSVTGNYIIVEVSSKDFDSFKASGTLSFLKESS